VSFFHTDEGPLEDYIERVEMIMDKGLAVSPRVSSFNGVALYLIFRAEMNINF